MHEAKTHLSRLVEEAIAGEEIVIARRDKPVARIVKYQENQRDRSAMFGAWKNLEINVDGLFDPALESEIESDFSLNEGPITYNPDKPPLENA